MTAMLLGNRRPADLERWGRLRGDAERIELLERRVPAHRPYLADFF
ncbi:sterol carrier protein domain-containing protein [Cohnella algarum]|nr:sterol carrier protein domain-containing protein [Cohnella algarum]